MRNQIAAAERLGLRAHTINSTNRDEWDDVRDRLADGHDRPVADQPRAAEQPAVPRRHAAAVRRVGRPAGDRRGALHLRLGPRLPARLPAGQGHARRARPRASPCSAPPRPPTTASWATSLEQLAGPDGEPLRSYRGPLARTSLRLEALELPRPAERLAWLVEHLPALPGSGIVYTLTKRDAEQVATFLDRQRHHGARPTAASRSPRADRDRGARCCATRSRPWSPRARWAWATTRPT